MIQLPLITIIIGLLTVSVRLTGLMLFAPFFGGAAIPLRIKAILVLALTGVFYPVVGSHIAEHALGEWPFVVITELAVGVGMGIATNLVFEAVQLSGEVLGIQMGYSLVNILDPQSQVSTPVVAMFYQSIVLLLFLRLDVQFWLLRAVGNSFVYLPPGSVHIGSLFTQTVLRTVGEMLSLGVQIAAPVLSATLVTDIILGLLGKASPQMPLMLLAPSVKSILGIAILIATLKYWPGLFRSLFTATMTNADRLLHLAN